MSSVIQYYPLDVGTNSGTNIANLITGSNVFDASLNGGAYISTSNFRIGKGALATDTSGQFVRINNSLTTTSAGISFAFWTRGNNGVGQYTLLDYSNGPGGNNRISLSLQNNTLLGQVVNGTTLGTVSFTTAQTTGSPSSTMAGVAYSTTADRFVLTDYGTGILYFRTGFTGANTSFATGYFNVIGVCLTNDGSRVVWSVRNGNCYYATWNGTTYSNITTINSTTLTGIQGIDITDDGKILTVAVGNVNGGTAGVPNWAFWTGSGYSTYRTITGASSLNYSSIAITPDGNRIAFADFTNFNVYYATWNGTNYSNPTSIASVGSNPLCIKFSKDGNILFITTMTVNYLKYFIWNGSSFGSIQTTAVMNGMGNSPWGLCLDYNNTIFGCPYAVQNLFKTTFNISNQYSSSNFYSAQNLNDNAWRHITWTIDTPNTTYKYYINGALIKTDISAGYAFPAATTRTNNLLANSTDLSMSFFTGGIDNYKVYSGVLTDAQVSALFKSEAYNGQSQIQYYTCDTTAFSSNNLGNYVSGSYIYDASLNAYQGANLVQNGEFNNGTTGWTTSGTVSTATFGTTYRRENIPYNITTFGYLSTTAGSFLSQTITFPKAGNYVLTFYSTQNNGVCTLQLDIGTLYSKTYSYSDYYWAQTTVPFYVSESQTQTLKFTLATGTQQVWISGIVIQNTDNYVSTTGFRNNQGSLSLDNSGQIVKMNAPFTTTSSGLTFALWARGNNGCGQNTLLDYSNGPGGNQKISLGLLNNSPYAQVINGTSIGTVSILTDTFTKSAGGSLNSLVISADHKRMVIATSNGVFVSIYTGGTWSAFTIVTSTMVMDIAITADGSRIVWVIQNGLCYFATWNIASQNYTGTTQTADTTARTYIPICMTADGSRIVTAVYGGYVYFANWTGTNYTVFTQILDTTARNYRGLAITADGSRLFLGSNEGSNINPLNYSVWNSSIGNYSTVSIAANVYTGTGSDNWIRRVKCSNDGNVVFISSQGGSSGIPKIACYTFNGTIYIAQTPYTYSVAADIWSMATITDGPNNYIYIGIGTAISRFRYTVSNEYIANNFYSAQNLNDNTWRHVAWTIDPSNTTYKYYINGSLIKTDISSGYAFPPPTTRTNNLLGTSADLPLSYFTGGIDNYQSYNGVLTDAEILALYKVDAYSTQTPVEYYTGEPSTVVANMMTNSITGVADAVLMGGASITTTNYKSGITSTGYGQNVIINSPLTTTATSSGLTFSFWFRSNNGSGINPLLDYSKGKGNNKVALALWNGSPYAQVISDASLGTITLTADAGFSKTNTGNVFGMTLSSDHKRMAIITTTGVYYATYSAGAWSAFTALVTATITGGGIAMSSDGSRIVWNQRTAYTYFSTWNSISSTYGTATQTLDTIRRTFTSMHMTEDGSRIIACGGYESAILYADWNGTNYSAFTTVPPVPNTIHLTCSATTPSPVGWGTPTAGNVFLNTVTQPETYYVWALANSSTASYVGDNTRLYIFEYNYNNTTGSSITATLYYIIDDAAYFYLNGVIQNGGAVIGGGNPNGNQLALTLPTGNNRFQFACYNMAAGAAAFAVIVKSSTGTLLFNTNATNSGWILTNPYCGVAITPDGNRIFYGIQVLSGNQTTTNSLYYADWDPTQNNYGSGTLIGVVNSNNSNFLRNIRCSPDGNIVFVSSTGTSFISWYVFNGTTFVAQNTLSVSTNDVYALETVWDGTNKYLYVGYATSLTRYSYTASNTYTSTNFYTTQNLNDNAWRHFAWTIDPSTTTYKYYLNGALIKTDTSSNFVFPQQTTRTNNLLLTSTDLPLSYYVGFIDNYRAYTGVLTDTQINTLFQTEAFGGQTQFQNYTMNQGTNSGVNIVNASTNLYDASLNGGAYISTTNYITGTGGLSLDTSGQYVKMNNLLTTTNAGLTFSLWTRGNNGCGQNTLLDYSNGPGGNQKISLGLYNNAPYAQVINGTSIGTVSIFTETFSKTAGGSLNGLVFSANHQRMVIGASNGVHFSTYIGGTWSAFTTVKTGIFAQDVVITADGSRIVWIISGGLCYFATWNSTSQNYTGETQTANTTTRAYIALGMTADGSRIVASVNGGYVYFANWTGTNYTNFTQTIDTTTRAYRGIALTADGSRLFFGSNDGSDNPLYYSVWNTASGNYGPTTLAANVYNGGNWMRRVKCSPDGNVVFITSYGGSSISRIACYTFDGTNYIAQTPYIYSYTADQWAMDTLTDGSNNYIYIGINTAITRLRYTVSNQYIANNFYNTDNLNDNQWRHIAWTIDPSNTTYKYYINGALIKTDVSSAYVFPALTSRTNNLLATGTDLSMSYMTGGIDQYRVQTGVLTDAQIYTLFQSDAYSNRQLIQYYTFDPSFNTGTNLANLSTNSATGVYDASLNGGAYISTTNKKIGAGALAIDTSGQSVRLNSQMVLSNKGQTFSFWARGNNGVGQYTLLDYSNGPGANNRISLGLQNNTLLGQVVNGTSLGTVSFTTPTSSSAATVTGVAYSSSANRLVWLNIGSGILSFRTGLSGTDTQIGTTYTGVIDVCMTNDGNRIVFTARSSLSYFATWNGSTNYTGIQAVNAEATTRSFQSIDMTEDGGIIVAAIGTVFGSGSPGVPIWARWNGTNYSAYSNTLNTTSDNYSGIAITPDGSRIAYTTAGKPVYYAVWNGTNYSDRILIGSVLYDYGLKLKFSKDGNILFIMTHSLSNGWGTLLYCVWNGTTFGPIINSLLSWSFNTGLFGMALDYNNNLFFGSYGPSLIYKTTITISNQYTATNFYSAQNLNDNTWRHIAWTIDPSNNTYKYYINGALIKTDISSGYTFPAPTTRKNNLLATATDLSLSYFIGGIDNYRMYSGVLTDAQIAVLAAETVPEGTLTTLYPLDTAAVSGGTNIANYASGSYVYDASLNGGATISTVNYKVGLGSLSLDASGQTLKINTPLTNTTGLSFLFWQRAANGTGQTTLLDYSGGPGANQKITYGLQNNQIYAQVTNGTTVGTLTFSTAQTASLIANAVAVAYAPTTNKMVYATTTGVLYLRTGGITNTNDSVAVSGTYPGINNLFLTSDGNRLVWSVRGGDAYFAQMNGSVFSDPQVINTGALAIQGIDLTDDGSTLAVVCGNVFGGRSGSMQWAYWTGSKYSTYNAITNTSVGDFVSCAITPDGSRITYLEFTTNKLYYALWNGTNYIQNNTSWTIPTGCRNMKMSKDSNILFLTYPGTTNVLRYSVWDGTTMTINTTTVFDSVVQCWGLWVDYDNAIYTIDYNNTLITTSGISSATATLYKTTFQASNQYTATHFYAQENLNNSVWRQCAWTIDPYTSTYKYYINGTLVKTDTSSNYVFPAIASRSRNQLGVSTDLSLSYFKGKLDYYRVYNGILTDAQIATAYQNEMYSFQPLAQYYTLDTNTTELVQNGYFSLPNMAGGFNSTGAPTGWNYVRVTTPSDGYQFTSGNIASGGIGVITPIPAGASQYIFLQDNGSNINQDITFPCAGNYLLTYYASARSGNTYSNIQVRVNIGTVLFDKITPLITNNWVKYSVSFYVSSACTQNLKFQDYSPIYNGDGPLLVGISIVSDNNKSLANYATGVCAYDASLFTGTTITTNQYKTGAGCLSLDVKGQFSQMSPLTTTANTGLSFSFWARANNGVGQYTLLDYSNGSGANNKISMGLQNNTLYAQVVNGTTINPLTFTTPTPFITAPAGVFGLWGLCMTADGKRLMYTDNDNTKLYTHIYSNGIWNSPVVLDFGATVGGICCTADGNRLVINLYGATSVYVTWNGTNYANRTNIGFSGIVGSVDMTPDGRILLITDNSYVYYSIWNDAANNYTTFTKASQLLTNLSCCAITPDGSRIAFSTDTPSKLYYSIWNNITQTYGTPIEITKGENGSPNNIRFSKDGNILFVMLSTNMTDFRYSVWNGITYSNLINIPTGYRPILAYSLHNLTIGWDNSIYIFRNGNSTRIIYRLTFQVSNQYLNTNFYSAQNLNDNTWRHYAWTIDPTNTTYRYYLNGALVYTDISAGYAFPASTTRTNNLLGTSTDLPLSYMTGAIDNYRVYNGVLTPQEISTMYNYENTGTNTLLSYYPLDALSYAESYVGNYTTGTYVYDATMIGGATITTKSNPPVGTKALNLDVSGQYLRMNPSFTTTNAGLTFSLWAKGNNGCGQNTLLDYSNGSGGNNRISLGLQNNTLLGQVVNGSSLGTVSFTTPISSSATATVTGIAYSSSANRLVWLNTFSGVLYFRTGLSGTDTQINGTAYTANTLIDVCMTNDGNRIVYTARSGLSYFATWNGSNYTGFQTVNSEATARSFQSIDMTEDGGIIVAVIGAAFGSGSTGIPIWAKWNGTNYSAYSNTLNTTTDYYVGVAITPDGNRIAYTTTGNFVYYAVWNGTNYSNRILIGSALNGYGNKLKFSKDGNILFVGSYGGNALQYCIWNGATFGSFINSGFTSSAGIFGMALDYNNNLFIGNYNSNVIYKTTFQVSNQYTATNFYSAQNLNDNAWRHIAWTIDPTNTRYKYYINGSLIKTDISAGYAFPASTTRTNNLLGVATDLSMSYFTGSLCNYRVQSGVLTDAQIYALYTADAYNSQSTIQYFPFDTASLSGTNLGNYASNSYYVMDASLNGGATISTSNTIVGTGALSLDISGQFVRLNDNLTTSIGLSFSFWMRGNNGCGQNTLLDYSNGSGGNNKITLGLQNNTLYSQVVNGTSLTTPLTFTNSTTIITSTATSSSLIGLCVTADGNRLIYSDYSTGYIYTYIYSNGSWTAPVSLLVGSTPFSISCTADGSRLVISQYSGTGTIVYATWNGTNYANITNTGFSSVSATPSYGLIDMTPDGRILLVSPGYYSFWNATTNNYTTFTKVISTLGTYGSAITPDGSRVAFSVSSTNNIYYCIWNNTTQEYGTPITIAVNTPSRSLRFSKDGNILFISSTINYYYSVWNGTSYSNLTSIPTGVIPSNPYDMYNMAIGWDNSIYICRFGSKIISRFTFQVANQYTASNFYSAQNLNDNAWRHVAWTIDPTNTTYKYYINGTLVKTDTSANYAFPGLTTRTNNLLGTSTDLSLSYFTGGIDNYRVYNGVLTDAQVNSLFTADAYNSQSLIQYYPFDTASLSGTNLGNYASNSYYVMDASLNGGATISTSNAIVGTGALSMDISGQFVRFNNNFITSSAGLTFSFWFRARNGVGQYTLLDYSNGSGGNNRISMGLQNNTLLGQVVNGNTIGNLSFTTLTSSSATASVTGIAYSSSANRLVWLNIFTGFLYYRTGLSGSDTVINGTSYTNIIDVCMTNDGNRIVFTARSGLSYFATWNGSNYTGIISVNAEATTRSFQSIDMTEDGGILVATIGSIYSGSASGVPIWARWNGTNYSAYSNTLNTTTGDYIGAAITPDGSRIAYTTAGKPVYYAVWNGTNYSDRILIGSVLHDYGFKLKFSKDGNILFVASYLITGGTGALQYCIWNGTTYGPLINSGLFSTAAAINGMALDYNNNLFIGNYSASVIYRTTFTISNQYTATNFYSAQNLNDNAWRHLAWTIDPSNTTYKYYLNGSLIKTDISSGYAFPPSTTRKNNLLATSTDLSLSYMTGNIDNYRVYNGVLTDAQVYSLFNADAYNSQSLIQYYSFDTTSSSGRVDLSSGVYGYANIANLVSGSNVFDASLNGGARLNSTNYRVGNASLELLGSGNHVRMNDNLTTSGIGLSFAFWARGNNGVGQYTLLDYSNGSGANNKISLGLENNTLLAQVVNGTTISNPTFATGAMISTGATSAWPTEIAGFTYAPTVNRFIYNSFTQGILYYRVGLTGANVQIATGYASSAGIAVTYDGSRIVWSVRAGYCYYATWSNSISNYTGITQINTAYGTKGFNSLDITGDGRVMVVGIGKGFSGQGVAQKPVWATWTGSGYSTYTEVSGTTISNYVSCAVTNDGSRIAYLENRNSNDALVKIMYYALWNGSNFVQANSGTVVNGTEIYDVKFSRDGNIMFILTYGANPIQYCLWTGSGYGPIINTTAFPTIASTNGLYVDNTNIYFGSWVQGATFVGILYGTTYSISNQYLNTNFYSAQNLNDNTWRHVAWTIDPSNTTYKYYLNGALIKTDISAGYAFPGLTTRTNNLLGTSTDLSMSYFTGGIDNYRVYNGVLTHAQILDLYNTEGYSNAITTSTGATLVQYYPFNSNKWSAQPALSANYNMVHQYTFDYHTFNECMVLNTANYTPVYDCRLTNSSTTAPLFDTADYKVGTSSLYFSANTLFLQVNGVQISASSGVSIACWFKYTSGQLFDFGNAGMDNLSYSPATGITFKNGLTSYTINSGSSKADTTWHHFAWTISSTGTHTVYIDGALSATTASVAPVSGTRINNYIGKGVGRIDDFRVYSGVLTLTDIQNLNNLLPTTTTISMVNYYPLDYAQIDNGFVPNLASGYSVYDGVLCNGTTSIPTVDISNNILGTACLYLPGTNQYAQIRQVSVNNTGMTIAVWLKVAVSPTGGNLYKITDFGNGTTGVYDNYGIYISNTGIGSFVYIGTTNNTVAFATTNHINGNWHHLAITMTYSATNTSTHVLYLDGTAVATSTTARYPVVGIRANNRIGCSVIGGEFVNGYMDDLRVYNGVMSPTDISTLYGLTQYDKVVKIPNLSNHYTFEPSMVGGNYVANMSSNTVKYDMVFGPGMLPTLDSNVGYKEGLRGLRLDGGNKQYVQLNNFSVPSSVGLTIACWFNYTSTNWSRLFDFCNTINTGSDNIAYSPNNGLAFRVGTTVQNSGAGSGKADGIWHHFAWSMVYAGSGVNTTHKIYIDGTPTTYTLQYPTVGTRIYNYIGKSTNTADDYATGSVDDFRIYYGVLTDAEITGIVGSPTYSTSIQPAIYYSFE